ncbi:unnamed protein product [Citrullus colocynthis]|uniref:Two-component response regulator n=1 Tax=Citrullus colocynthis TaxID=252529 RepID=A0ABP0ZCR2_9ROSI
MAHFQSLHNICKFQTLYPLNSVKPRVLHIHSRFLSITSRARHRLYLSPRAAALLSQSSPFLKFAVSTVTTRRSLLVPVVAGDPAVPRPATCLNFGFEIGNIMEYFDNQIPNPIQLKAEDDQFPIGLKVLAIDANIVCLHYLVQLLQKCQYKVTATTKASEAIKLLKDEKQTFDLVITDVVRHDMDGFKLLQIIGVEMDIPVVMVSANDELETVKRGVMEGAEAYLLKPVRIQELRNIWQHVLRKRSARKRSSPNLLLLEQAVVQEEDHNSIERVTISMDKQDYENDQIVKLDDDNKKKKHRVSWTKELHEKFVEAYEKLGEKERVPNNILKLMNDPSLTRENVASHLQKHRDMLRKKKASGVGKLASQKNLYDRNPTKASTPYHSMNHMNIVSNLGSQFQINSQFQLPNGSRSSMEGLQGNQNPRSTWTAAGSCCPVPEFKWLNFPSNNSISKPCNIDSNDQYLEGFGPNNSNSYYPPLETNCNLTSISQSLLGNYPIENHNIGAIPEQAASLTWSSFPNNTTTSGQCSQMQFNAGNPLGSLLIDDDLAEIFKQEEHSSFDVEKCASSTQEFDF